MPKLSFKVNADNKKLHRRSMATPLESTKYWAIGTPFKYGYTRGDNQEMVDI